MNSTAAAPSPAAVAKKPSSEQKSETPTPVINPTSNPNPTAVSTTRASRWSDAPPSNDAISAPEPPQKKVKNDVSSLSSAGEGVAGHGTAVNEGPPGLAYAQTASATTTVPSYGASEQGGTGYSALQQTASYQSYGSQYQALPPAQGSFAPGSAKGTGALFYKTKLCTKFKIGACTFNERCHFAHGIEDLRKPPPLWETMSGGLGTGSTTVGGSTGSFNVQPRPKTRPCRYFAEGNCPYNERCNFLHGNEEPQRMPGVGGSYAGGTGMQGPVVAAAQPQGYSGVSAYPNGGNVSTSMQYPNMNAGYTAPAAPYANPSMVPSSLPTPYGAQANYPSTGAVAPSMPPYGSMPVTTNAANPYPSSQDGTNGASANYNSWNSGPGGATAPGYTQTNQQMANQGYQTASWMPNYAAGGYPKAENEIAIPQYPQEQAQHNQITSSTPYVQGVSQNPQQGGTVMQADGNHFQSAYSAASYPSQQADYTARYNMAEAWGGKTQ